MSSPSPAPKVSEQLSMTQTDHNADEGPPQASSTTDNNTPAEAIGTSITNSIPTRPAYPIYYFFYGTLQSPSLLQALLGLPRKPSLHPARITGFKPKLWGPYPALVDGAAEDEVRGMAYEVQSQEHAERLAAYETDAYVAVKCCILLTREKENEGEEEKEEGGGRGEEKLGQPRKPIEKTVEGMVYKSRGDGEDLEDGVFNLEEWEAHMARAFSN